MLDSRHEGGEVVLCGNETNAFLSQSEYQATLVLAQCTLKAQRYFRNDSGLVSSFFPKLETEILQFWAI